MKAFGITLLVLSNLLTALAESNVYEQLVDKRPAPIGPKNWMGNLKRSLYEEGQRVPYLVRWPKHTPAGSTCSETICLNDFMSTSAEIAGVKLSDDMAVDSHSLLKLYEGGRREVVPPVIQSDFDGGYAIHRGDWKLIFTLDPKTRTFSRELYNLKDYIKETTDVLDLYPEVASQLAQIFEELVRNGRSTIGPKQTNFEDPE